MNKIPRDISKLDKFEATVRDEWFQVSAVYLEAIVFSMPDRCKAIVEAKEGNTEY